MTNDNGCKDKGKGKVKEPNEATRRATENEPQEEEGQFNVCKV